MKNKKLFHRLLCFCLTLLLLISSLPVPVLAAGAAEITFADVGAGYGEIARVPVIIQNNPGIATFRFRITYDTEGLEFVAAEKGEALSAGTLSSATNEAEKTMTFLWFATENVTGDGSLVTLEFRVKDGAYGQYPLAVTYLPEDMLNEDRQPVTYTVTEGSILVGSEVRGTVSSFGEADEPITLRLLQNSVEIDRVVTTDGSYAFQYVAPGTYQIEVSKFNHVTKLYDVTVQRTDVVKALALELIVHTYDNDCDATCNVCGYVRAIEHSYETEWSFDGKSHWHECTVCHNSVKDQSDHIVGELIVDCAPTCVSTGVGHRDCTVCLQRVESDIVIPVDDTKHIYDTRWSFDGKSHWHECTVCHNSVKDQSDHIVGELIVDRDPTCVSAGVGHRDCTVCLQRVESDIVIPVDAAAHQWESEYTVDLPANCFTAGSKSIHCALCDTKKAESVTAVPATGAHVAAGEWTVEETLHYHTCTTEGCTAKLDEGAHVAGDWIVTKPATATVKGEKVKKCVCGKIMETAAIPVTGKPAYQVFTDVKKNAWYHNAVTYAYNNKLFSGTSATTFGPEENMTRAMFVTVLGRLHGVSVSNKVTTKFADVKKGQYYTGYVKWGTENGIVAGLTPTTFGPEENITREQICALMVRYSNYAGITLQKKNAAITFKDAARISKFARSAVKACQQGGLVNGEKSGDGYIFRPQGNATRAEVAVIIMNFAKAYK